MKPFDLEKALNGCRVITRGGINVSQIVKFDIVAPFCIFGVVNGVVECWDEKGRYMPSSCEGSNNDLFMAAVKRQEWRALYKRDTEVSGYKISNFSCENEQDVLNSRERKVYCNSFVKAILIREWEE